VKNILNYFLPSSCNLQPIFYSFPPFGNAKMQLFFPVTKQSQK